MWFDHLFSKKNTQGHLLVVMLAYLLERKPAKNWRRLEVTIAEALDEMRSYTHCVQQKRG